MRAKENYVVGIGEALWDVLPDGKKIGGAPANFAYHVSQFGLQSLVVSAIGDDKLGNEIMETFRSKELNVLMEKVPCPTGTVQVQVDGAGQYSVYGTALPACQEYMCRLLWLLGPAQRRVPRDYQFLFGCHARRQGTIQDI